MKVKICGITRQQDAELAVACGAVYVGFVFHPKSPRYIAPNLAAVIAAGLPAHVDPVGVFVDLPPHEVQAIADLVGLKVVQLHGQETPADCRSLSARVWKAWRATRLSVEERDAWLSRSVSYSGCEAILIDATASAGFVGGGGVTSDWQLAATLARTRSVVLAGGLNADNVVEAVKVVSPWAIDVSSGVEDSPGRKSEDKMRALFAAVRSIR